jgi:hypothetical protein
MQRLQIYVGGVGPDGVMNSFTNKKFKSTLSENSIDIVDEAHMAEYYLANDYTLNDKHVLTRFPKSKRILLAFEPRVVLPKNYKKKIRSQFGLVISRKINDTAIFLQHPQYWEREIPKFQTRKDKAIIVNANKISLVKGNNYGLRKLCATQFEFVELFGHGWDLTFIDKTHKAAIAIKANLSDFVPINLKSLYIWLKPNPISLGAVPSKEKVMKEFKYALVIENESTYVSEKIFDALFSGCIPIYVGPPMNNVPIPLNLYVQAEGSLVGIEKAFRIASCIDYSKWQEELEIWLRSDTAANYWDESVVQKVLSEIIKNYAAELA